MVWRPVDVYSYEILLWVDDTEFPGKRRDWKTRHIAYNTLSTQGFASSKRLKHMLPSAECSKHFHRLYHNTRDCSTPAYYKRCARLLTRLAMSPLCTQS
uniref:Uncharacterized protein n=1 Tax=Anser cygnoides TaxID=8845 RepID=A0A8B9EL99_ANSCY